MLGSIKLSKVKEPKQFEDLNNSLALYIGRYANWKSGGFKGVPPLILVELIIDINENSSKFLSDFKDMEWQ